MNKEEQGRRAEKRRGRRGVEQKRRRLVREKVKVSWWQGWPSSAIQANLGTVVSLPTKRISPGRRLALKVYCFIFVAI